MSTIDDRTTLIEISYFGRVARQSRTEVWFPLVVFGLIQIPGSALAWVIGREHLGSYFLPMHLLGGFVCAWHYRRTGRTTGLQAPLFAWLAVILAATVLAAACSVIGRERGWDALNLGGPAVAFVAGYGVLASWARSKALLLVVSGIGAIAVVVLTFAKGDTAIGLQLAGFAAIMLAVAAVNYQEFDRPA